jgi:hypothetical protein
MMSRSPRRALVVVSTLLVLAEGLVVTACATTTHAQIRADAARRWNCPEGQVDVEPQGGDTLRASGCGKTLIYVCSSSPGPSHDPHSRPMTEEEAQFHGGTVGECVAR